MAYPKRGDQTLGRRVPWSCKLTPEECAALEMAARFRKSSVAEVIRHSSLNAVVAEYRRALKQVQVPA